MGRVQPLTPEQTSAGHLIVRQLETEGVTRVYCVPGESYLDVLDGLHDSPIRTVVCRQEGGAGFMAVAEGRLTGRAGVAMVTRGPGAANAMISVHTAFQDATPMVLFVGLIPAHERGRDAFQEFDLAAWFGTTAKRVMVLEDAASAATLVSEAMAVAAAGRPGPVVVGLPEATLREATDGATVRPRHVASTAPTPAELEDLEARIASAARPVLQIGGEDWDVGASRAIESWARSRGMGIIADFRAYDGVDHDSPAFLGALGFGSAFVTNRVLAEADLLVFLGTVRGDVSSGGFSLGLGAPTVAITPDHELRGHFGRLDAHIPVTTRAFAGAVDPGFTDAEPARWVAQAREEYLVWRTPALAEPQPASDSSAGGTTAPTPSGDGVVDLDAAFRDVQDLLPRDAIVTCGAGNYGMWAARFLPSHAFPSALGPRNGAMGFGLPAGVAAGLVHPERPVFTMAGDGCYLMNGQEFATAVAEGVDLTVLVVDNSQYGTIVAHQEREYPGRSSGTALRNPDFAAVATAYGGLGLRVDRTEDFRAALAQALAHRGPALVHVLTDPAVRGPRTGAVL